MDMHFLLLITVLLAMAGACSAGLYKYKRSPLVLRTVTWYSFVEFLTQAAVILTLLYQDQNRLPLLHVSFVLEALALLFMYREIFKKYVKQKAKYVYRKIFITLMIAFSLFAIANAIWWQSFTVYPSNTRVVLSIMIIILNILYIYKYTSHEPIPRTGLELVNYQMSRISLFWITTGLLLFHGFSLFRYAFINILREELSKEAYKQILDIQAIFAIILFVFVAMGFIKAKPIVIVDEHGNEVDAKKLK